MGPMIRKDLLEELDLEVPETIDEWHDVLTALKENGVDVPLSWNFGDKGKDFWLRIWNTRRICSR